MWKSLLTAGALALATALPAGAATLNVVGGILTGASGVTVGTKIYNVEFLDGSCVSLFSNCAAYPAASFLPPFAFTTLADTTAASEALLLHVFVDGAQGNFDTMPGLTRGCITGRCYILTPLGTANGVVDLQYTLNAIDLFDFDDALLGGTALTSEDLSSIPDAVYARWTEVAVIPLPAGAPLILSGLAALAGLGWRKRRERRRAQV